MALLLYGNARDVKMTVGYDAGILPVVSATSQPTTITLLLKAVLLELCGF